MILGASDPLSCKLLTEILLKLKVKDVVRCMCVCRSWKSLIVNPNFITTQVTQPSVLRNPLLLVQEYSSCSYRNDEIWLENYSLADETFHEYEKLQYPFTAKTGTSQVVGSCNGLVCLCYRHYFVEKIVLWNPSIKKSMILPPSGITCWWHNYIVSGFGFDLSHNDYKMLRIAYSTEGKTSQVKHPPKVELYSLKARSWRSIDEPFTSPFYFISKFHSQQAFVNGVVHWIAESSDYERKCSHIVLSFDMGDEVFGELMLPDRVKNHSSTSINVLGESLCLFEPSSCKKVLAIWVMEEYGVAESWTPKYNFYLLKTGLHYYKSDITAHEILIALRGEDLTLFSQRIKDCNRILAYNYVESLVLLNQGGDGGNKVLITKRKLKNKNRKRRKKNKEAAGVTITFMDILVISSILSNFLVLLNRWKLIGFTFLCCGLAFTFLRRGLASCSSSSKPLPAVLEKEEETVEPPLMSYVLVFTFSVLINFLVVWNRWILVWGYGFAFLCCGLASSSSFKHLSADLEKKKKKKKEAAGDRSPFMDWLVTSSVLSNFLVLLNIVIFLSWVSFYLFMLWVGD